MTTIAEAVGAGELPGRVWMYSNYHCNLACSYCLTESGPGVIRRELSSDRMLDIAHEAAELGFTALGVTGGEPFLLPDMAHTLAEFGSILPTVGLTNGHAVHRPTARGNRGACRPRCRTADIAGLGRPGCERHTARGPDNFAKVVAAIPALIERGVTVRIATTGAEADPTEAGLGVVVTEHDLPAELTITADGAFWSPFGPTVERGQLDTDLLLTRTTEPLRVPAQTLLGLLDGQPPGTESTLNIL